VGTRSYSTITYENSLNNTEFYEWLCGFVDGEGTFRIKKDYRRDKFPYSWEFTIFLHLDDKHVLDYIQKRLNIGHVRYYDKTSKFSVYSKTELNEIINIFSKYPLNTSKRLNFEDWKKAFELYYKDDIINGNREKIIPVVEELREGMNKGRYYETFKVDNVKITKYWLLGFIEGEGSFNFQKKGFAVAFTLGQVSRDKPLLEQIVEFLKSYSGNLYTKESVLTIYDKTKENTINQNPYSEIRSSSLYFLRKVLVPLLSDLNWRSKKYKDHFFYRLSAKKWIEL